MSWERGTRDICGRFEYFNISWSKLNLRTYLSDDANPSEPPRFRHMRSTNYQCVMDLVKSALSTFCQTIVEIFVNRSAPLKLSDT
jgi:hypothetical protein